MANNIMTRESVLFDAQMYGPEFAQFQLLMNGPDRFDGTYDEYNELYDELDSEINEVK